MKVSLLAALCLAAAPAFANPTAEAKKAIEHSNQQWMAAVVKGDGAAVSQLYSEDAVLLPANDHEVKGRAAVEKMFAGLGPGGVTEIKLTTTAVEVHGDAAIETGTYSLAAKGPGGAVIPNADEGKYLVVWKKAKGKWLMHKDIWNSSKPNPAMGQGSGSGSAEDPKK